MATALCPWRGRGEGPVAFPTFFHLRIGDDESMVEAAKSSSSRPQRPLKIEALFSSTRRYVPVVPLSPAFFCFFLAAIQFSVVLCLNQMPPRQLTFDS